MGKRSRDSTATSSSRMSSTHAKNGSNYGTIADLEPGSPPEQPRAASALVGPVPTGASAKKSARDGKNIWDEYYPLIQPAHQYHHRNDRGSSNYFFHGMFSADVMWAYRDAVIAYLVALYSMVVLSLTGLVFCKQWGISSDTPIVFAFRCLWFVSPAVASLALRNIAKLRLLACNTPPHWNIPPLFHLFKSSHSSRSMLRLALLSYAVPVLCELAAYSFTAATRVVNPFNRTFVRKLEMVFSFNDVEALDSGLVFYVFYISLLGIFWDPVPPQRYDVGLSMGLRPLGTSWFFFAMIQEIGWSGSLFPALEIVFSHSTILASAITGCIWALWHWPMIIADALEVVPKGSGYAVVETREFNMIYVLVVFTILLVGSRIIMCWIQGNSSYVIWSSVVYHATHNLFITSVFGQLTAPLYDKAQLFSFFSSEASICLLVTTPTVILQQVAFDATVQLPELKNGSVYPRHLSYRVEDSDGSVLINGSVKTLDEEGNYRSQLAIVLKQLQLQPYGTHNLTTTVWEEEHKVVPDETRDGNTTESSAADATITFSAVDAELFSATYTTEVVVSPGWVSLLPPCVTLVMSAVLGQVMVSLLAGIWCGAIIVSSGNPFMAFLRTFDQYWADAFTMDDHAGVLLFTIILGGTIGVVQKGGGGHGLALAAKKFMTSSLRMQLSTWLLCLVIFFDDYSSILIVGSSLRQVLSQTGVSREKFAAIIHTIGVCLPSMSPVSSWIGVEIGYVAAQLRDLKLDWDPFVTCLSCLHYRFFPILFIAFIFITIICEKDFGPMVQFEKDAAASPITDGPMTPIFQDPMDSPRPDLAPLEPDTTKPLRWQNAVVPFLSIVVLTFVGMIFDGFDNLYMQDPNGDFSILDALSHCDSVSSLIRASAAGWVIAVTLLLLQRIITLNEATKAWMEGVKDILDPTLILTLAWALGAVIGEVNTAPYIASVVGDSIPKQFLPAITCLLCYVVSFAVGSAFGTMAIMFPIIAPLSWSISGGDAENLRQCFGSILGGSVFGNSCSPIADTSILASLSAHVPLENHVRSILPYAVLVAVVSVVGGALPIGLKICSPFTAFGVCLAVLLLVVMFCGTKVNTRYRSLSSCSFLSVSPPPRYDGETQPLLSA
ncbi:hypothetical protein PHYBOEH_000869 [Phytophthora boehmeriae]|uniref:Na+/H+ antiporter NhaC-like C-terminal domain-containing protein n=1 Tax=Phytophthora boehmeriae TaxID=109152 RepID=A0A8T1WU65_9STRA|nr:hypothetical protein PHYBOEH_000869 [Phytophthora boehmeriae]